MLFKPLLGDQLSGSLGGITASHNKGGTYFRQRAIPTDPGSSFQVALRGFLTTLSNRWLSTLTAAQRAAWDVYAANVTVINRLGDAIHLSGINHYVRSNVPRLQAGLPRVDDGPTTFNTGEFTHPAALTASGAADTINMDYDNTDDWANENDSALVLFGSREQNTTINFFKGPYRYADKVEGDSVTPPTSPLVAASPFPLTVGNRVFVMSRCSRADGRLSEPFRGLILIA